MSNVINKLVKASTEYAKKKNADITNVDRAQAKYLHINDDDYRQLFKEKLLSGGFHFYDNYHKIAFGGFDLFIIKNEYAKEPVIVDEIEIVYIPDDKILDFGNSFKKAQDDAILFTRSGVIKKMSNEYLQATDKLRMSTYAFNKSLQETDAIKRVIAENILFKVVIHDNDNYLHLYTAKIADSEIERFLAFLAKNTDIIWQGEKAISPSGVYKKFKDAIY